MTITVPDSLIAELKDLAETRCDTDNEDFSPFDYQDGPDDAWDGGNRNGEIENARMVLDALGVSYTIPEPEDD